MLRPFANRRYVEIHRSNFEKVIQGKNVDLYTIGNPHDAFVKITNYGSRIQQIVVPNCRGRLEDVVLGYESIGDVITGEESSGAFIGRYANRIAGGKFALDGLDCILSLNDAEGRPNTLHGGRDGSFARVFDAKQTSDSSVEMSYKFQDGEEGFPGTLALNVVYTFDDRNQLTIDYSATAGAKRTVCNLTSHPFFNLSGDLGTTILEHFLSIRADIVLDIDKNLVPTGVLRPVIGTPMDFNVPKSVARDIAASYDLQTLAGGYDHTYVVKHVTSDDLVLHAKLFEPRSGRTLEIWSSEPALQFYSGQIFAGILPRDRAKGGTMCQKYSALALEPMHYPDSPNRAEFPTTVLEAAQTYHGKIVYRFGIHQTHL